MTTLSSKPTLLTLPAEIRLMIYKATFSNPVVDITQPSNAPTNYPFSCGKKDEPRVSDTAAKCNAGLLLTCKLFRSEATTPYFQNSIFYGAEFEDCRTWLDHRRVFDSNRINDLQYIKDMRCGLVSKRIGDWKVLDRDDEGFYKLFKRWPTDRTVEENFKEDVQKRLDRLVRGLRGWGLPVNCVLRGTAERIGEEEKWDVVGRAPRIDDYTTLMARF